MDLNTAQRAALKAAITADATVGSLPLTTNAAERIANRFNRDADPAVVVWKSSVPVADVLEMCADEIDALTAARKTTLSILLQGGIVNCDRARVRTAFTTLFPVTTGSAGERLLTLFRRNATRAEAVFATGGNGDAASPHRLVKEGEVDTALIEDVRAS